MARVQPTISMVSIIVTMLCGPQLAWAANAFHLEEATIPDVHRAIRAGEITAVQLINLYFKRIEAYNGTCVKGEVDAATGLMYGELSPVENAGQLNAYMTLNIRGKRSKTDSADNDANMMDALEVAQAQDNYFERTGKLVGPLHGVPIAVKDNYDTADMRTTGGAAADYANDKPPKDATIVAKLRAAGAIILGKTNLDEYAPAGIGRSTLGGQTCNPYDTKRITGGSSDGSAAAVAANLAICALGTDTAGSVRYPAALNALVGMVATQGLTSRAGILPLSFSRDRGGPLCRTVADTAAVLEVLTGYDPRDSITAVAHNKEPVAYVNHTGRKTLERSRRQAGNGRGSGRGPHPWYRDCGVEARRAEDIAPALEASKDQTQALYVVADPFLFINRIRINTFAQGARLPTMHAAREYVEAGGLMSYGPSFSDLFRRTAELADKILRGTKPADIPVEQPTKFDLVVNLVTAKALGITISPILLARAEEVIE